MEGENMSKTITVGWFKQKSGMYALKGITIREGDRAYDSTSTFREADAEWLTKTLGANPDVELSSNRMGPSTSEDNPEWAAHMGRGAASDGISPLDWEQAGAALLRHFLAQLIEMSDHEECSIEMKKLASQAGAALLANDAGTHCTLNQARAILDSRAPKPGKSNSR
jgi:hypothetical protein